MCVRSEGARPQRVEVAGLAHRDRGTWRRVSVGRRSWARSGTRRFRFRGYQRAFRGKSGSFFKRNRGFASRFRTGAEAVPGGICGGLRADPERRVAVHESMPGGPVDDRSRVRNR